MPTKPSYPERPGRKPGQGVVLPRRDFLVRAGMFGGAAMLGPALLAACGGGGSGSSGGAGKLVIANWPFYIDDKTIGLFQDETGISTEYIEEVNDNQEWFAKYQEQLSRGDNIGRDITVLTDWMAGHMIELGYVDGLDKTNIPNADNLVASLKTPSFDPDRTYTLPWASGMTGLAYDVQATGGDLTSINDIFDAKYSGRVTMLTEMRDTFGLVMLGLGLDPANASFDDAQKAADKIKGARDSGQIRRFTGNDYGQDLTSGDVAVAFAWSGDIVGLQPDNPNLRFLIPDEGGMLFSDNMMIPAKASNKANAEKFMNYVYDPANSARIFTGIQYIPPVEGAKEEMVALDPSIANNPLVNPPAETTDKLKIFKALSSDDADKFDTLFQDVIGA